MEKQGIVLIVDDNSQSCRLTGDVLEHAGYRVFLAESGEEGLKIARQRHPDVIVLDRMMPGLSGDETAAIAKREDGIKDIKIIILSAKDSTDDKVAGLSLGVDDYLTKPFNRRELIARVQVHLRTKKAEDALQEAYAKIEKTVEERTAELSESNRELKSEIAERERVEQALRKALDEVEQLKNRLQAENIYLQGEIRNEHNFEEIVSVSVAFERVLHEVNRVAPTSATVLILGESGTGKELLARAIHSASERKHRPLVKVNCAALPATLIEAELFGHEKGAFTGALARKIGHFELAHGGTIFLDEIGDLPLEMQAKLLRVLQEGEIERLGNPRTIKVDVRVIAATNRNLSKAVQEGGFREDLYYRLNVFPITAPPLRDRTDDIPVLAAHFIKKYSAKIGKPPKPTSDDGAAAMRAYRWPGNVRELENIIERAIILSDGPTLNVEDHLEWQAEAPQASRGQFALKEVEKSAILGALAQTRWVIEGAQGAALLLGLEPSTLRSRMKKHGIRKPA